MASMKKSRQTKQVRKANIVADAPSAWQQTHDAFQSLKEQLTAAFEDAKARAHRTLSRMLWMRWMRCCAYSTKMTWRRALWI